MRHHLCDDLRDHLLADNGPLSATLERHVHQCEGCRMLYESPLGSLLAEATRRPEGHPTAGHDPEELQPPGWPRETLLGRLRSLPTPLRRALSLASSALVVWLVIRNAPRADLAVVPIERWTITALVLLAGLMLNTWDSLRPLTQRPLPEYLQGILVFGFGGLVPVVLGLLPPAHHRHPASLEGLGEMFAPAALGCFGFGVLCAVPALLLGALLSRTGHGYGNTAWLAAATGATQGLLALHMHCPIVHPEHLLVGHLTAAVALLAGYGGIRSWLALPRPRLVRGPKVRAP